MPSTTTYKRGGVVLVPFPFTGLSTAKQLHPHAFTGQKGEGMKKSSSWLSHALRRTGRYRRGWSGQLRIQEHLNELLRAYEA